MREDAPALAVTVPASDRPRAAAPSERPDAPLTGSVLDHFEIGEKIGQGGMGDVYAAHDVSLDRSVAIKVLREDVTSQSGMSSRFLREARAQARFNHPNIVHIYYIGRRSLGSLDDDDQALYFAMERIHGGDLDDLLREGQTMAPEDARDAMIQVAQGLRAAHRAGVIHRDIKPGNLMLGDEGVIKIADFGLAKPLEGDDGTITQEGAMVGSPYYMAPEQVLAGEIDHRADMYALGAAFYHLLTGRPPFEGPRAMAVVAQHLSQPPVPIAERAPHVPERLARIVERLLEKKPEDRYADYDALLDALSAAAPTQRAYAPIPTRGVAALGDFLVAGALIGVLGSWGWIGLLVYLALVTAGHAWRGQTPAKLLLGIEVRRADGGRLGWGRSLGRTLASLWLPILMGATIALTSGIPELLETIDGLKPGSLEELHGVLMAMAIGHGFLSLLYFVGLGMALFSPQRRTVHDLLVGSVVTYRLRPAAPPPRGSASGVRVPGAPLSASGRRTRPDAPADVE